MANVNEKKKISQHKNKTRKYEKKKQFGFLLKFSFLVLKLKSFALSFLFSSLWLCELASILKAMNIRKNTLEKGL